MERPTAASVTMPQPSNEEIALRVSLTTILGNIALSICKAVAGIVSHSNAMIADAIHSATDVVSTFVLMIGIKMSAKDPDKTHPYGYERMENVAAIILAMVLAVTGLGVGAAGMEKIISGNYGDLRIPGRLALIAAIVSIVTKEAMYWYTRSAAKRIASGALMADAWHHRADAFSSIGSFIGVLGARMGAPVLDSVASLIICGFILKAAIDVFRDAVGKMTDKAADPETRDSIRAILASQEGVRGVETLKTRLFGDKVLVDVDILTDADMPLSEAALIENGASLAVEEALPGVRCCTVRTVPYEKYSLG